MWTADAARKVGACLTAQATKGGRRCARPRHYGLRPCLSNPDEGQLAHAAEAGRVLYTFNVGDFMNLHGEYISSGQAHAGIIFGDQQRFGGGEQMRRLLRILALRSAEQMRNNYEFLSAWQ